MYYSTMEESNFYLQGENEHGEFERRYLVKSKYLYDAIEEAEDWLLRQEVHAVEIYCGNKKLYDMNATLLKTKMEQEKRQLCWKNCKKYTYVKKELIGGDHCPICQRCFTVLRV